MFDALLPQNYSIEDSEREVKLLLQEHCMTSFGIGMKKPKIAIREETVG